MRPSSASMRSCARCSGCFSATGGSWNGVSRGHETNPFFRSADLADLAASFRTMWIAPALSVGGVAFSRHFRPAALAIAAPILALWFVGPALAWWSSRPLPRRVSKLTEDDARFLHGVARKTWAFFDTFVGPKDHWLPPDNVQEHPAEVIAHRTSPTNMGCPCLPTWRPTTSASSRPGDSSSARPMPRTP
jgi:hypothetical protein